MASKKFWSGILSRKKKADTQPKEELETQEVTEEGRAPEVEKEIKVEEVPSDSCRFCYDPFTPGQNAYKCLKCSTLFHYPKCLRSQTNCRVCGEKIVEHNNIVKLIRFKNVVCPSCGMKIKLFYGTDPKLQINCPGCGREGHIPNPYLKDKAIREQLEEEPEKEYEEEPEVEPDEELVEEDEAPEAEPEASDDSEEIDIDLSAEPELEPRSKPSIIKPGSIKKRKPKLVLLDESKTCNVCLGSIKTGLPVVVCRCGKYYHDTCADRVKLCPICDADFSDVEKLIKNDEVKIELSDEDLAAFSEPEPAETKQELILESKLDPNCTFKSFTINDQNKIIHSIAQCIAQAPGSEFKLLYIYGSKSLGKTHLMNAIGNYIRDNDSGLNVIYTTTNQLFSKLVDAKDLGKQKEFEEFYNSADVLLLDDLHELPKKKAEQEIFFRIFDNLLENNKQLVFTGDRAIDEITTLNKKLANKIKSKCGIIINLFESDIEIIET